MNKAKHVVCYRIRTKIQLIEEFGGRCKICGYDKTIFPGAFNFHHRDPKTKAFNIGGSTFSLARLREEAKKCDLLCCRCHAELHGQEILEKRTTDNFRQTKVYIDEYNIEKVPIKAKHSCLMCPKDTYSKFCSPTCFNLFQRRVIRPSKEELEKLVWEMPTSKLAIKFGVSDNAVTKWCVRYGIKKPGRGYWATIFNGSGDRI